MYFNVFLRIKLCPTCDIFSLYDYVTLKGFKNLFKTIAKQFNVVIHISFKKHIFPQSYVGLVPFDPKIRYVFYIESTPWNR